MIVLYEHPLSPYAQKNKIALREKGVPFELRLPTGIGAGAGMGEDFMRASPRGEVPALIDGATRVFDSTVSSSTSRTSGRARRSCRATRRPAPVRA